MSAFVALSSGRICLRRWRDEDREAFAAMNSDPRVMEFFPGRLSRVESDALADRIQEHFREQDFGLWAIEIPDVAPFIGFAGLAVPRFSARFTPCVEVGWRLAFVAGVVAAPMAWGLVAPLPPIRIEAGTGVLVTAGLLVGVGTRFGAGCTSGHGICGLSRLSLRSLVATLAFMGTGFFTVLVTRHLIA